MYLSFHHYSSNGTSAFVLYGQGVFLSQVALAYCCLLMQGGCSWVMMG